MKLLSVYHVLSTQATRTEQNITQKEDSKFPLLSQS